MKNIFNIFFLFLGCVFFTFFLFALEKKEISASTYTDDMHVFIAQREGGRQSSTPRPPRRVPPSTQKPAPVSVAPAWSPPPMTATIAQTRQAVVSVPREGTPEERSMGFVSPTVSKWSITPSPKPSVRESQFSPPPPSAPVPPLWEVSSRPAFTRTLSSSPTQTFVSPGYGTIQTPIAPSPPTSGTVGITGTGQGLAAPIGGLMPTTRVCIGSECKPVADFNKKGQGNSCFGKKTGCRDTLSDLFQIKTKNAKGSTGGFCIGDECITDFNSADSDRDGVRNTIDTCSNTPIGETVDINGCSASQKDSDGDGVNDTSDSCPSTPATERPVDATGCSQHEVDTDMDGKCNSGKTSTLCTGTDNCPTIANGNQNDRNTNGVGDACDDPDQDGLFDTTDNCKDYYNPSQEDMDKDGIGNPCDSDKDGDGVLNTVDDCSTTQGVSKNTGCPAASGSLKVREGDYGRTDYKSIDVSQPYTIEWTSQYAKKVELDTGSGAPTDYTNIPNASWALSGDVSWANKTRSYALKVYNKDGSLENTYTIWVSSNPSPSISNVRTENDSGNDNYNAYGGITFNAEYASLAVLHYGSEINSASPNLVTYYGNCAYTFDGRCAQGSWTDAKFYNVMGPKRYFIKVYNKFGAWQKYSYTTVEHTNWYGDDAKGSRVDQVSNHCDKEWGSRFSCPSGTYGTCTDVFASGCSTWLDQYNNIKYTCSWLSYDYRNVRCFDNVNIPY